jgi:hypothetical protein
MRWQDPLPEPEKMPPTGVTKAYLDSRSSLQKSNQFSLFSRELLPHAQ